MKPGNSRAVTGLSVSRRVAMRSSPRPGKKNTVVGMGHCDLRDILCLNLHKRGLLHWT